VAVEARNLAGLPGDVDFTTGASLPISALTAWQGLFDPGHLQPGQAVLVHGAAGAVGTMATQLAREDAGARERQSSPSVLRRRIQQHWVRDRHWADLDSPSTAVDGEVRIRMIRSVCGCPGGSYASWQPKDPEH
jgi:hypothetical protein